MPYKTLLAMLLVATVSIACEKEPSESVPDEAATATASETAEKPAPKADDTPEEPEPSEQGAASAAAKDSTGKTTYDPSNLPEAVEADDPLDQGLAWSDQTGENLLVFTRKTSDKKQEGRRPALTTVRLTATHWQKPADGEWTKVRAFNEVVSDCSYDSGITPYVSDWSLTDIDEDQIKEATFAWSAGCRSDMSPITHKVLMTENGEKWVLRGQTALTTPDEEQVAGELKDTSSFDGASKEMRAHADKVWDQTSNEMRAAELEK